MLRFIAGKIGYGLLVLWGAVTVVFLLFNLAPGDPARNLVGENASEETVQQIRHKLHLDGGLATRYAIYMNQLSPLSFHDTQADQRWSFDDREMHGWRLFPVTKNFACYLKAPYLGRSFRSDAGVATALGEVLPGTFLLAFLSIALAMIIGLPMGVLAARYKDHFIDRALLIVSALGMSGPSFFVAILVAWLGAIVWYEAIPVHWNFIGLCAFAAACFLLHRRLKHRVHSWLLACAFIITGIAVWMILDGVAFSLPGTHLPMTGSMVDVDVWSGPSLSPSHWILPILTLMVRPLSVIVQLTRSSMLDVLEMDFIRTARAKGLSEVQVLWKHALRNALNPVITAISGWFASLLAGAIFVEFVFGWRGLGQYMFTAIENRDMPVVMGGVLVVAALFVLVNIAVDLTYAWIDPRVRVQA
ncbi:MAG: ABC transporter permease [Flavobacteriales bacterium]